MEPFTRMLTDDLLAKVDKALTEHPDECPLEDMKRFAVEYRDGAAAPRCCLARARQGLESPFSQTAGRHRVRDVGIRCATL